MHMADCEIADVEVRGRRLVVLYGPHKINATEGAALLSQYGATHGGPAPVFASPDGWQLLEPVAAAPVAPPPAADPVPVEQLEEPAASRKRAR